MRCSSSTKTRLRWCPLRSVTLACAATALAFAPGSTRSPDVLAANATTDATAPPVEDVSVGDSERLPCLGFLLPDLGSVVTSAHCAKASQAPHRVVLVGVGRAPLVVTVASFVADDRYHDDEAWAFDAAIGSLTAPVPQLDASPVVFDSPQPSSSEQQRMVRYELSRGDRAVDHSANGTREVDVSELDHTGVFKQSEVRVVANSECEAISGKRLPQNGVLCAKCEWPSVDECHAASTGEADNQLVTVIAQGDTEHAFGFVAMSFPCSAGDNSTLFVVTSVVDLQLAARSGLAAGTSARSGGSGSFNPSAHSLAPADYPPSPSPSASGSTRSSSTGGASSSVMAESSSLVGDSSASSLGGSFSGPTILSSESTSSPSLTSAADAELIPVKVFAASVRYPFAYLSAGMNASIQSAAAFHIYSTLLVANADWITDREQIKWVLFEDDKIPVKRLWFHSESTTWFNPPNYIVVIELARAYKRQGVRPTSLPSEDARFAPTSLQLSFLDPVLLQSGVLRDDKAQLASVDVCGLDQIDAGQEELSCLTSSLQSVNSSAAVQMGFVLYDGKLAGLVSGYHTPNGDKMIARFLQLAQDRRRGFLLSVFVESYRSREIPPEASRYLASTVQFFDDGFPVGCGGIVISPDAVLTTATCALSDQLSESCLFNYGGENNYECTILQNKPLIHPLYEADAVRYNFAIVKLSEFFPASAAIALAPFDFPVGGEGVCLDLSSPSGVESCVMVEREQCAGSQTTPASTMLNDTVCVARANGSQAEAIGSNSSALVGNYHGKPVFLGFQVSPEGENLSVQSYSSVMEAREFIYANVYGIAESSSADKDVPATIIPDEVFSASVRYPFAYLSDSMNASTQSVAAVHLTSTFLVANADWISDREQIKWVLFEDDKVPVKKLSFHSERKSGAFPSSSFIVMVELVRGYKRRGVRPVSLPQEDGGFQSSSTVQLSFLDPILLQHGISSDDNAQLAPLDACGLNQKAAANEGLSCVTSEHQNASTSAAAVRMGFVMYEGKLAGIVSGYHQLNADVLKVRFMLPMQEDRRGFMFDIFVDFFRSAELTPEESKYRTSAVWFFENQVPVECGGVLVAPDAILTTASCASQNQLSTCLYGDYDCTARTDKPLLHPLYEVDAVRYNFAIVKLVNFLPASATISLAPANFPIGSEAVHVDLSNPSEVEACVVIDSEQCADSWGSSNIASATLSEMVCAVQTNGSDVEITSSSSAALVGSYHNKTMLLGIQSVPDVDSSVQSYSNIADAKEFIYANVYGFADSSGVDSDGEDTTIPDDVASAALRYPFAYLSSSMNVSTKSVAAFHISPRFVVANADWIDAKEQVKWVLLEDDKIPVKKLWVQRVEAWNTYPAASFIVMIELERAYYRPGLRPVSLPLDSGLELSFLDPILLHSGVSSDASAQVTPVEECGLNDVGVAEQEGLSCLASTHQNVSTSVAVRMGFVLHGGKLVGLTSGFHMLSADVLRVRFLLLSDVNRRNFMLNVFVESHWSGETTPEESEYIRPTVQFFDDGFPVDCGGISIAPDAVLTTASCALTHHFSSIAVMTESGSQVLEVQPGIMAHQEYQAGNKDSLRYNFAIVKLTSSLPESAVVALAPSEVPVGSEVVRVDLSSPPGAEVCTVLDTAVCTIASKSALSASSGLPQASSGTICAGNANGNSLKTMTDSAALLGTIEGTLVLVGLLTEHDSNPSVDNYASVLDAVEFVNANAHGRTWGSEPSETGEISDEVLRSSIRYPFVYLLCEEDVPADPVAAVQISPTVVLASAEWIQEGLEPKWVLFEEDRIPVQKIQFEASFRDAMGLNGSSSYLMLIKLERPYAHDASRGNSLSLLTAESQTSFEVKLLDPILLRRELPQVVSLSMDSSSACSLTDAAAVSEGLDCVHSSLQNVSIRTRGTLVQMGFLLNDSVVVGLGTGSHNLAEEMSVPFARFDFEPRKAFIDTMTSLWSQDAKPTPEEMKYRGAAVQLVASGKILDCGGMLIAPEFVLTTASCVQAHEITAGLFGIGQDAVFVGVLRNETVVHPLYQSGDNSTLRYNLAIIKLSSPQPASVSIALAPFEELIGSDVVRVDLSGGTSIAPYQVLEFNKCRSSTESIHTSIPGALLPGGTICAGNETVATETPNPASAALLGTFSGKLVLVGLQVGPDIDPYTDSYVNILGAANFINAYVYGHVWGRATTGNPIRFHGSLGFVVGLRMTKTGQNFCGGALIASQYVLTAAHCVSDGLVTWASIGYEAPDKSTESEEIQVLADRIRIHPKFGTPNMYSFDAAILELKTPAYHLPMPLDSSTEFVDGASSELISFGAANKPTAESPDLHELKLALWSHKKCQAVVPDVDTSALCAGGEETKDACTGESGSPLTISTKTHEYSLIGLVSAGYGCGQAGVPGLYTRISSILDFVAAYTTPTSSTPVARLETDTPTAPAPSATPVTTTTPSPSPSTTARGSGSKGTGGSSLITPGSKQSETGKATNVDAEFPNAIGHQTLSDTTDITKGKVDQFFVGTTDTLPFSTELRNLLTNPTNEVTLYSTGDLSGLLRAIAAHDAIPLNQREDRFGSVSDRRAGKQPMLAGDVCR